LADLPVIVQQITADISELEAGLRAAQDQLRQTGQVAEEAQNTITSSLRAAGEAAQQLGSELADVGKSMSLALSAPAAALAATGVGAWKEQELASAKLRAVLQATGDEIGVTADRLEQLASELQRTTTFGDEAIIAAEALLATFNRIQGINFERAVRGAVQLAAVTGRDLTSAAMQLGKALQDPAEGLAGLARFGLRFTEHQRRMLQQMVETGRVAEAQAFILSQLESRFGSAAQAMAQTSTGAMLQVKNAIGDTLEVVGKSILTGIEPALRALTSALLSVAQSPGFQALLSFGGPVLLALAAAGPLIWGLGKALAFLGTVMKGLSSVVGLLTGGLAALSNPITAIAWTIGLVVAGLMAAIAAVVGFMRAVIQTSEPARQAWERIAGALRGIWEAIKAIIGALVQALAPVWQKVADWVAKQLEKIAGWIERNIDTIARWVAAAVTAGKILGRVFLAVGKVIWNTLQIFVLKPLGALMQGLVAVGRILVANMRAMRAAVKLDFGEVQRQQEEGRKAAQEGLRAMTVDLAAGIADSARALGDALQDAIEGTRRDIQAVPDLANQIAESIRRGMEKATAPGGGEAEAPTMPEMQPPPAPEVPPPPPPPEVPKLGEAADKQAIAAERLSRAAEVQQQTAEEMQRVLLSREGIARIIGGLVQREAEASVVTALHEIEGAVRR
jgi:hypothetical protein